MPAACRLPPLRISPCRQCRKLQRPRLLARRTERQEPKLLWRGRAVGGSSTINGQIAALKSPAAGAVVGALALAGAGAFLWRARSYALRWPIRFDAPL